MWPPERVIAKCDKLDGAVTKCDHKWPETRNMISDVLRSQIVTLEDLKSQNAISNSEDEDINERLTSQIAILEV